MVRGEVKGIKHMVTEGDLTLGGEHTMQYGDDVLQSCILKYYIILLTNVILII